MTFSMFSNRLVRYAWSSSRQVARKKFQTLLAFHSGGRERVAFHLTRSVGAWGGKWAGVASRLHATCHHCRPLRTAAAALYVPPSPPSMFHHHHPLCATVATLYVPLSLPFMHHHPLCATAAALYVPLSLPHFGPTPTCTHADCPHGMPMSHPHTQ